MTATTLGLALALFCAVIGAMSAGPSGVNIYGILLFTAVAIIGLQLGYIAMVIARAMSGGN
jgi:hypothetical protein